MSWWSWRRPLPWLVLAFGAFVAWSLVSLALVGWHAKQANAAVQAVTGQITTGAQLSGTESIDTARSETAAIGAAVNSLPLKAYRIVPYVNTNFEGVDAFAGAVQQVLYAAEVSNELYARLSGSDGQGRAAFVNGAVSLAALQSVEPRVQELSGYLAAAEGRLMQVPTDVSPILRRYVDPAASQVAGVQKSARVYQEILPDLPQLLGERRPVDYLVVFHNPGELFPGGGAALNVALLRVDEGRFEVVDKGAVSTQIFPGNPRVAWDPLAGGPYYEERGARDGFAWSNLHQDFRVAGEDLMRSWVANGRHPVDGVISLDPVALQAAVAATGPIASPLYGDITADNLVSKLFYEEYNQDPAAQAQRHEANQQLIDTMLTRMQEGATALTLGRAIFAAAPGHHMRVRLSGGRLAEALSEAHAAGAQPDPQPDRIAFYTQNQNASKVDIFQTRRVTHDVFLEQDGSARVVQVAKVTNEAPENGTSMKQRIGYTTRWAFHWNVVLLPEGATDVELSANPGKIKKDNRVFTDVDGRKVVRVGRWIRPGGSSVITVTYRLPEGTFGSRENLEYRVGVERQLTLNDVDLLVNVHGPSAPRPTQGDWRVDGDSAMIQFPVTTPTALAVEFD